MQSKKGRQTFTTVKPQKYSLIVSNMFMLFILVFYVNIAVMTYIPVAPAFGGKKGGCSNLGQSELHK